MENKLRRGLALLMTLIMLISCAPMDALAAIVPVSGGTQISSGVSLKSIVKPPVATHTYIFMNGDTEFARQIVKGGESLNNPGTPDAGSANKEFTGWRDGDNNAPVFGAVTVTETKEFTYHAQFADVYFVFFTNEKGEVMVTKKGKKGDTISAEGVTYPVGNEESIVGWEDASGNLVPSVTLNGSDVTLKAKVEKGHWITYDSQGGTYVEPAFVKGNGKTTAPANPSRPGYTFKHWSETVDGAAFDFGQQLDQALTLHAVWTPNANTRYTVIHWLENADDNEYSYRESETRTGATGAQTSAAAKSYTGFTAQTIAQQTIAGDGSTIVNVYYKRNVYDVKFFEEKSGQFTRSPSTWEENTSLRITAKHGANIRAKWPTGTFWYVSQNNQNTAQSNLDTMPIGGKNFYGKASGNGKANYYVEVLPGESGTESVGGKTYKLDHTDTGYTSGTVTDEERYEMTGFTCNVQYSAKNGSSYSGSKFYYDRNSYDVVYINSGSQAKVTHYLYQQSIADAGNYELTDADAPAGKEGYVFAGWYDAPEGGNKFIFTGKTMPAQNVTVYAKWNEPAVNGKAHIKVDGTDEGTTLTATYGEALNAEELKTLQNAIMDDHPGYTWRGWRTGPNGTGEPFNVDTKIYSNITLFPYYTKDGTFTVEYVSGKDDVTAPVDGKSYAEDSFADLMSPGKLVAADGQYFLGWSDGAATYQPRDKYQIKSNHANEQNVITLTAKWGARPAGTTLTYKANGGTGEDVVENLANNATVTTKPADTFSRVGYTFKGWDTNPKGEGSIAPNTQVQVDNKDGENVLYAIWEAKTDTKYTVEFYYEDANGNYTLNHKDETRTATTDTRVEVTDDDKAAKENGKYVYDESAANVESGIVKGDGLLVLKLYFKLNTASYTIHHYLNGTTVKVADDQTGAKTIGETLTANKSEALYPAYAAAEVASYAPSQTITIAADESKNVITVYYTVPLTIKAKDASKTYDGKPLTQTDFTMEGLVNGDTKENFTLSMTAASTITNAGDTPNVIDTDTVKYNGGAIPSYYNVSYNPGTLTVNKASANVTITGVNETHVYDGTQYVVNGYNYSFTGKPGQITISPKPNVLAIARRTDVGTTYMGLTKDSFTVTSANYDVTIKAVIDGYVTITPVTDKVTVTVTENSATVTYDGEEHSVKGYKLMTADNTLYDVTKSVKATETAAWTAKGTNAGEYPVGVAAGDFENINKNFTNVAFKIVDGVLKINPITENTITITANSASKIYDGAPLTNNGFTFTEGVLVKGDELTAVVEGSQTDVGVGDNVVTSYKVTRGNKDVTGNYTFGEAVKGTLTVNKRPVTIIAQDNKKEYDGQSHGKNPDTAYVVKAAAENSGLVSGHTESNVNIAFTAVDAGTYAGMLAIDKTAVTIVDSNNKNVTGNYAIELEPGTLTIEQHKGEVIVTIKGNTQQFTYDCTKHTVQGFTVTVNNSLYNVNTDFTYDGKLYEAATLLAVAEGTNVGVYRMNLLGNHCVNLNKNFANVTFRVQDGSLAIERQYLAIEVDNSSKVYGAADPAFADATLRFYNKTGEIIKPSAEMMQDVSTIDLTVHRADAGDNTIGPHVDVLTISKTAEELNKIYTNYEIGVDKGDFEITPTEESLKVRADNYEGAYDGDGHGVVAKAYVNGTDEEPKAVIRYYNEGTGKFDLTESPKFIDVKSDTPGERTYTVRFQATLDGLTAEGSANVLIAPRKLVLSSGTESKDYDGLPLTSQEVVIEEGSIINDQIHALKATGSVTTVAEGTVVNTITYSTTDKFKPVNYDIVPDPGTLHIEKRDVILTSETASKEYDGTPLTRENVTVERNGFVDDEVTDLRATGSVTYVDQGEVTNTITFTPTDKFDENNYNITKQEGKLRITKRGGEGKTITVTAANDEKVYDGTPLTNNGFTHTGVLADGDVLTAVVEGSATNVGDEGRNVVKSYVVNRGETDVTKNYTFGNSIDGKLTINPRKVTLKSADLSKTYDGTPLVNGKTALATEDGFVSGEGATYTFTGSQTVVGSSANAFTYTLNEGTNAGNYEVAKTEGMLTVTQNEKAIKVTANSHTWEYDGQPHSDGGYTVEYDGQTYKVEAGKTVTLQTGDIVKAKITKTVTNVSDSAANNNKIDELTIVNAAGEDTKGQYKTVTLIPGTLTITKRGAGEEKVKITAADNTVEYDGQPHGAKLNAAGQIEVNVSYTTEYLAPGHKVQSVVIDGSRTKVGLYKDELVPKSAVIVDKTDKDVTENYEITYVRGTLEIKKNETEIKVTANSHTWEYDGQAHSDGGYTVTYGNESYTVKAGESATLSTGDKVTAVVKGQVKDVDDTKAGNNEIVEWSVEHRDFYNNVTPANGTLTITPRKVTLTSASDSKPYDGTPLTKPEVAVTGDGFVAGEVSDIEATGSVTYVSQGEVDNLITFKKNEGFKDSNYGIEEKIGKLSIEALDVTIIITGPSAIREYKPGVTHTIVTGGSELDFVYGSDKVDGKIGVEGMVEGDKILPGTLKHTLEGMYVGEYEGVFTLFDSNGKKADKPTVMHDGVDVTENYKFSYNPGKLTITGKHMDGGKEVENEVPEKNYLLGQKIPFTITVRSVSKDELKDVTVTDPTATILPDRNTANPAYTVSEDEHTATITSLAPEAEVIVYAEHEVTEDDIINRYTNEATINWGNDEVKVSKTPSIEEENPEAELVKEIVLPDGQDENHKFKLGETVYFKITVTNTGNVTLNEYEVKEVLPGAAFIDGTGYTLNNDKTVATIEKMEPVKDGQEAPDSNQIVLYAQYNIKEEDLGNKELKNIVTADNSKPGEVPIPVDEAKSVSGQKIWKDEGNAFNTRPASITLTLMRKLGQNGAAEQYRTMQLGSNGSWRYSFDHLPKHDAQENEYFYWVVEEPVTGYDTAYETKDESHCDIVNNLQTYTLTIHYWQHKLGDTKMEQAFPDYVATLYYKQPYDVESPEREGIILDDMSQARISGTMPAHDLVIDVYYHRIAYRLTIHYIYQDGTMAHEDYTWTYWFNSTYNVPSPIIPGFTPSIDVIAGRMPSHGLELTVVYVGDGEIVIPDEDTSLGFKSYLNAGECFE